MFTRLVGYFGGVLLLTFAGIGIFDANSAIVETKEVEEPLKFTVETILDSTKKEGTVETKQEGKNGSKIVTYSVTTKNRKEIKKEKQSEKVIVPAQNRILIKGTKKVYKCSNGIEYNSLAEKEECEKKISWESQRDASLQECYADSSKFNCWYDEYPGTTLHWEEKVYSSGGGTRVGAICRDGWRSNATGRGACSHHGGVSHWITI